MKKFKNLLWILFSIITPALIELWVFDATPYGGDDKTKMLIAMYILGVVLLLILRPLMDILFKIEEKIE